MKSKHRLGPMCFFLVGEVHAPSKHGRARVCPESRYSQSHKPDV